MKNKSRILQSNIRSGWKDFFYIPSSSQPLGYSGKVRDKLILINILVLFFFILDRLFKKIALLDRTIDNLFFNFSLFKNPNLALSIPFNGILFYFLLIIIFWWLADSLIKGYRDNNILKILAFSLIFAGAISNLFDRLQYKAVIDYLSVFYFPIINLADLMISGGVIILILSEFSSYSARKNSGTK